LVSIAIISFSSCSKCTTCTKSGGSMVKLCEKDYSNNTSYGLAVDIYQNNGYNCK
jgi:hypothetical protein